MTPSEHTDRRGREEQRARLHQAGATAHRHSAQGAHPLAGENPTCDCGGPLREKKGRLHLLPTGIASTRDIDRMGQLSMQKGIANGPAYLDRHIALRFGRRGPDMGGQHDAAHRPQRIVSRQRLHEIRKSSAAPPT